MIKNKLVIAMAVAALMSSMGAVANTTDSFEASYKVDDQINIDGLTDVALTSADVDASDGSARGSTDFCVGRAGAAEGTGLGFKVTITSDNSYQLMQGEDGIAYQLHYTDADTSTFEDTNEITADNNQITGTTELLVSECGANGTGAGYMWVSVPPASQRAATTGTYTDTVTMTVEAN